MHAAKCVLDLNKRDLADSLDFDMNLKTNPTDMIQIGAYTKKIPNKKPKHQKKGSKNSPIQNSPKPFEFLDLDLLARTELIYALTSNMRVIKDQRAKVGTIIWMTTKGLMV